jgi:hypothetical protein
MAFHFPLDKLMQDLYNVVVWYLFLLLPQWCLVLPPQDGVIGHKKTQFWLKHFLVSNWEKLQKEFFLWAQALAANSNSIHFPGHDLPTHKCLLHNLTFGHAKEYFRVACTLAPFSLAPMFFNTTLTFITLHLESDGYFPLSLEDYELN